MSAENLAKQGTDELVRDLTEKRRRVQQSFKLLKHPESTYGQAHQHMLCLYDVALEAVQSVVSVAALSSHGDTT